MTIEQQQRKCTKVRRYRVHVRPLTHSEPPGKLARGQGKLEYCLERFGGYDQLLWF